MSYPKQRSVIKWAGVILLLVSVTAIGVYWLSLRTAQSATSVAESAPPAVELPVQLEKFIEDYQRAVLPLNTLVQVTGEFEVLTRPRGAAPDSPRITHHEGSYTCVLAIGDPLRIYYQSPDYSVPTDPGGGKRQYSFYDMAVFGDGTKWVELENQSNYLGHGFRPSNEARIYPLKSKSWYTSDSTSGTAFFPLNRGFMLNQSLFGLSGARLSLLKVEPVESGWRLEIDKGTHIATMLLNSDYSLVEYSQSSTSASYKYAERARYSDFEPLVLGSNTVSFPRKVTFYRQEDGGAEEMIGTQTLQSIEVLAFTDPKHTFTATIPAGWSVNDNINDEQYIQGEPFITRTVKKLKDMVD